MERIAAQMERKAMVIEQAAEFGRFKAALNAGDEAEASRAKAAALAINDELLTVDAAGNGVDPVVKPAGDVWTYQMAMDQHEEFVRPAGSASSRS